MKKPYITAKFTGWQWISIATGSLILLFLLWFRLGSLTFGNAADVEVATNAMATSWGALLHHPLNLPYDLALKLVHMTGHTGVTSLRLISTLFAAIAAVLFYIVIRQWHSPRVALLGTWLFVSSAWFLHTGRLGTPEILWLVGALAIVVTLTPNRNGRHNRFALPSTLLTLAVTLYVPGMIWLVLSGLLVQRRNIVEAWRATAHHGARIFSLVGTAIILAPLGYGLATNTSQLHEWLGFGTAGIDVSTIMHNLVSVPLSLTYNSSYDAVHFLDSVPLLAVFEIAMLFIGLYFYCRNFRAARSRLIAVLAVVGWILVGTMGRDAISLVLPVVYLLIASGIAYMLHIWMKVFPNNPVARYVSIAAILLAVLLTSAYQTRSYFVAWRYNTETYQVFRNKIDVL